MHAATAIATVFGAPVLTALIIIIEAAGFLACAYSSRLAAFATVFITKAVATAPVPAASATALAGQFLRWLLRVCSYYIIDNCS